MLLVGTDDGARIYLNEKEVYRRLEGGPGWPIEDEVTGVELKAGLNVLVLKVVNVTPGWAGSVRFVDAAGKPVPGLRVTLDPDARSSGEQKTTWRSRQSWSADFSPQEDGCSRCVGLEKGPLCIAQVPAE